MTELAEKLQWIRDDVKDSQHVYHHHEPSKATVSVKVERNSRSINWEASVSGASSVAEALKMLDEARTELEHRFGTVGMVQ